MQASNVKGHCQACGRIQVVLADTGLLAQHGYTVRSGYFSGVCRGSAWLPLESQRSQLDWIVADLERYAQRHEKHADDLASGVAFPFQAIKRDEWRNIVRGERNPRTYERPPVMVDWFVATDVERSMQIELEIGESKSESSFARSHAESLLKLATRVHGQPLIDRTAEEMAKREKAAAKTAPIPGAFRTKAAQKDALDKLNLEFSKLRSIIMDTYLADRREGRRDSLGGKMYDAMPFDLHCWRPRHAELVLLVYPHLEANVREMNRLYAERVAIRAMPVIK